MPSGQAVTESQWREIHRQLQIQHHAGARINVSDIARRVGLCRQTVTHVICVSAIRYWQTVLDAERRANWENLNE